MANPVKDMQFSTPKNESKKNKKSSKKKSGEKADSEDEVSILKISPSNDAHPEGRRLPEVRLDQVEEVDDSNGSSHPSLHHKK